MFRAALTRLGTGRLLNARRVVVAAALISLGFQQGPDESNVPESEKRIPAGHFCMQKAVYDYNSRNKRATQNAHPCDCQFSCNLNPETGEVTEQESPDCQAFCHVNGRRCTCHTEEPCPGSAQGNALMDMNGHVVAVLK